jgi:hypothetical protein
MVNGVLERNQSQSLSRSGRPQDLAQSHGGAGVMPRKSGHKEKLNRVKD